VKFYLYISDTKLDMLAAQIPQNLRSKIAAEAEIDLGVLSVSLRGNPSDDTHYSKLAAVTRYIDESESVGTVDDPSDYFRGTLALKWGPLGPDFAERPPAVYFTGATERTFLGLGGSAHHVIGARSGEGIEGFEFPNSAVSALLHVLAEEANPDREVEIMRAVHGDMWAAYVVSVLSSYNAVPPQEVEFLARRLAYAPTGTVDELDRAVLLGTPIYVALA
jgi:hypothetical protein